MSWLGKISKAIFGSGSGKESVKQKSTFVLHDSAISSIKAAISTGSKNAGQGEHIFSNIDESMLHSSGQKDVNMNFFDAAKLFAPRASFMQAMRSWHFNFPDNRMFAVIMTMPHCMMSQGDLKGDYYLDQVEEFPQMGSNLALARQMQNEFQYSAGCLFAESVTIPGEAVQATWQQPHGESTGGLIGFPTFGTRQPFTPLSINFRETNVSFIDFVLRPWLVIASHLGLAERAPNMNMGVKSDIYIIQFGKAGVALQKGVNPIQPEDTVESDWNHNVVPLIPRKIWRFLDCVPVRVPPQTVSYSGSPNTNGPGIGVEFRYTKYEVHLPAFYLNQAESVTHIADQAYASPEHGIRMSTRPGPNSIFNLENAPFQTPPNNPMQEPGLDGNLFDDDKLPPIGPGGGGTQVA